MKKENTDWIESAIDAGNHTRILLHQVRGKVKLTPEEENKLCGASKLGDLESRNRLVISSLHQIVNEASRYYGPNFDDLFQSGAEGVTREMKNLDLQRGKIPNFVRLKSREAISQQVADMHRLFAIPQYLLEVLSETTRSWEAVSKEKKITPTAYDLVPDLKKRLKQKRGHGINGLNVDERSVQTWLNLIGLSHTPALSFEENPEIEDLVPDQAINQSPEISFFAKEREEKLKEFVKFLNNGSGLTKKEKSALMGVWKIDGRGISRRKKEPIKNFKRRYLRVWDYVRRARRKLQKNPKVKTFYKELVTE